jgi:hypothetical protein
MATNIDYVAHLTAESARFGAAIRDTRPAAPVPTCPDWNADDLLWHLAWVQSWWGIVVRDNVDGPQARAALPARPDDRAGLLALFEDARPTPSRRGHRRRPPGPGRPTALSASSVASRRMRR